MVGVANLHKSSSKHQNSILYVSFLIVNMQGSHVRLFSQVFSLKFYI